MFVRKGMPKISGAVGFFLILFIWALFLSIRFSSPVDVVPISGSGMYPILSDKDVMIVDKTNEHFERFSLVSYQISEKQRALANTPEVKRVGKIIGLPTEFIEITPSEILINDKVIAQLVQDSGQIVSKIQIPVDHYFIILDGNLHDMNKAVHSTGLDSRQLGFIQKNAMELIVKKYDFLKLPRIAMFEIISGGFILFLFIFAHWYIKHISLKFLPLTIITYILYAIFFIVIIAVIKKHSTSTLLISIHYNLTHSTPHTIQKELIPTLKHATAKPNDLITEKHNVLITEKNDCSVDDQEQLNDCLTSKYIDVDRKLNEKYRELMNSLEDGEALKKAEIAWIKFRDLTCSFTNSNLGSSNDYSYNITNNKCLIDLTEKRIIDLEQYSQLPSNNSMQSK